MLSIGDKLKLKVCGDRAFVDDAGVMHEITGVFTVRLRNREILRLYELNKTLLVPIYRFVPLCKYRRRAHS